MNFAPITLPKIEIPLPKEVRRTILQHAHEFIISWGTVRPAKEVVYTQLVPHLAAPLAKAYEILVDEEHNDLVSELVMSDEKVDTDIFRGKWGSTILSKVLNKTPGIPKDSMIDCFFDYEGLDGPLAPKREPWKDIKSFCDFMANHAIRMLTDGRMPGQALSYFGIVASDLEGIEVPGYVPPDRENPVVKTAPERPVAEVQRRIDFAMSLVLDIFCF